MNMMTPAQRLSEAAIIAHRVLTRRLPATLSKLRLS
jgi:hypothetical protein